MAEPLDAIWAFHNAFRRDMSAIDEAALGSARSPSVPGPALDRFRLLNEILVVHARGEELSFYPALEAVVPLVAEAYERQHRGLDEAFDAMGAALSAGNSLDIARTSAAATYYLDRHLANEEAHLYRLVRERVPIPQQMQAVGVMSAQVPRDQFAQVVTWLYRLIGDDDRENLIRLWQTLMPAPVFASAIQVVQQAIPDGWAELTRRIPALEVGSGVR